MADYTVEKIGVEDISFGTSTFNRTSRLTPTSSVSINQVNAGDIPLVDAGGIFTATNVEDALAEITKTGSHQVFFPGAYPDGSAITQIAIFHARFALTVTYAAYIPHWLFKQNSTDYSSLSLINEGTDGLGAGQVAEVSLNGNGTIVQAHTAVSFGTINLPSMADGEILALEVDSTKGGNGTAFIPPGIVVVEYSY